jgi:hypothetical protein
VYRSRRGGILSAASGPIPVIDGVVANAINRLGSGFGSAAAGSLPPRDLSLKEAAGLETLFRQIMVRNAAANLPTLTRQAVDFNAPTHGNQ